MICICDDSLFAGECPTTCLVRWATDGEGGESDVEERRGSREGKHRRPPTP